MVASLLMFTAVASMAAALFFLAFSHLMRVAFGSFATYARNAEAIEKFGSKIWFFFYISAFIVGAVSGILFGTHWVIDLIR